MKANIKKKMDELAGGAESNYMEGVLDAQSPDNIFSNGFAAAHDIYQPIVDELLGALGTAHDLIDQLCSKSVLTNDKDIPLLREYQQELDQAITKVKETLGDEETSK